MKKKLLSFSTRIKIVGNCIAAASGKKIFRVSKNKLHTSGGSEIRSTGRNEMKFKLQITQIVRLSFVP